MSAHSGESVLISPAVRVPPPRLLLLPYYNMKPYQKFERHDCHFVPTLIADWRQKTGPADENVATLSLFFFFFASWASTPLLASRRGLQSKWLFEGGGGAPLPYGTRRQRNWINRGDLQKTTQQECIIRQQLSAREAAIQTGRGVTQRVTKCEDQCEGCRS